VDLPRENVLAGAAFSGQQDCRVARRSSVGGLNQAAEFPAPACEHRHAIDRIAKYSNLMTQFFYFQRAVDRMLNLIQREGLVT
jgi:hypothetical protein